MKIKKTTTALARDCIPHPTVDSPFPTIDRYVSTHARQVPTTARPNSTADRPNSTSDRFNSTTYTCNYDTITYNSTADTCYFETYRHNSTENRIIKEPTLRSTAHLQFAQAHSLAKNCKRAVLPIPKKTLPKKTISNLVF